MTLTWIKEQVKLWLIPNNSDSNEVFVGYDFAIRAEIIGWLAEQMTSSPTTCLNAHDVKPRLLLDEHESALG